MITTGLLTCVVVCALAGSAAAISNLPQATSTAIVVDGTVSAVAANGTTVLIGGAFTHAGNYTGGFASAPAAGGTLASLPAVNGTVNAAVPDGSGGWYVGGSFTSVGQTSVTNLAHITSSQTVDASWNPAPDNTVNALALSSDGTTLYVGGSFATIGGTTRNDIAALTASSGATTAWNPNADAAVSELLLSPDGATLYVAGSFASIGGSSRSGLAALTTAGGVASTWNPAPNATNTVAALAVSSDGATVYAGGSFTNIGGASRANLAAISSSSTGTATSWNPAPSSAVSALALSSNSSTVYVGGTFTSAGGQARTNIAAISASGTGTATSWDPSADGSVNVLAVSTDGKTVYAGGAFANIGGQSRDHVAALAVSDGTATSWQEDANATVSVLAVTSSSVGIGGALSGVGLQARNEVAAFSTSSGLLSVNPGASGGVVNAVAFSSDGSTAYVGGAFTTLGGQARNRIGAFSMTTGLVTSWNPNASAIVYALAVGPDGTVYAGGSFTTIGGSTRNHIAALDSSAVATAWNPNASAPATGYVYSIALATSSNTVSTVYVGGAFTTIGGQSRNRVAGLDPSTGNATAFNNASASTGQVSALQLSSDQSELYAGGTFAAIGGQTRKGLAELDATTGTADATWNPNPGTAAVTALALSSDGTTVYVGGSFTTVGGQTRNRLGAVTSTGTGTATTWNPNASGNASALAVSSTGLVAGGAWTTIGSIPEPDLAVFAFDVPVATVVPSVTGTATVGSTLTCSSGTWANAPTSYTYAWQRGGTAISGATASTYQLVSADLGQSVACKVTAKNGEGSASSTSSSTTVVAAPQNTVAPTVLGSAQSGSLLTCSPGTWTYSPVFTYTWLRDGATISGVTSFTYTVGAADAGHSVACAVKGTNAAGSAQASSAGVAIPSASVTETVVPTTPGTTAGATASVDSGSGSLDAPALAMLAWGVGTFPGAGTISVQPVTLTADVDGFSHTSPIVSVTYLPAGSKTASPTFLQKQMAVVFPAAKTNKTAYVAYLNGAGTAWTPVPQLSIPKLAAGQLDGYFLRTDSSIVVYTHHTAVYGLLKDIQAPTAPPTFVATLGGPTLRLRWPPSADNSRRLRSYQVLRGKKVIASFKGSSTSAHLSLAGLAQTSVFTVRAVDFAGNVGKPSPGIRVVVKARPKIVPKRIPAWAPLLRAWQAKPVAARGRRPVTPEPVPAWYAAWRTWIATRLSLRP